MKKVVVREFDRTLLGIDIMLYCIIAGIGYISVNYSLIDSIDSIKFAYPMFYLIGFFGLLAYFLNRRSNDYEFLGFGLINICVATFILINAYYTNEKFILVDALSIYIIANLLNKAYHTNLLVKEKNINYFPKVIITIVLALIGIYAIISIYGKTSASNIIFSYYFLIFGLLSLIEPLLIIITGNPTIEKKLTKLLHFEDKESNKKTNIREVKKRKIVAKVKEGTIKKKKINKTN